MLQPTAMPAEPAPSMRHSTEPVKAQAQLRKIAPAGETTPQLRLIFDQELIEIGAPAGIQRAAAATADSMLRLKPAGGAGPDPPLSQGCASRNDVGRHLTSCSVFEAPDDAAAMPDRRARPTRAIVGRIWP
jgi:hypothetical protein